MSRLITILLAAIVLSQFAPSYAIGQVAIDYPRMEDKVCRRATIAGTAPIGTEKTWLVVRSMDVPQEFWVQPFATVDRRGG